MEQKQATLLVCFRPHDVPLGTAFRHEFCTMGHAKQHCLFFDLSLFLSCFRSHFTVSTERHLVSMPSRRQHPCAKSGDLRSDSIEMRKTVDVGASFLLTPRANGVEVDSH